MYKQWSIYFRYYPLWHIGWIWNAWAWESSVLSNFDPSITTTTNPLGWVFHDVHSYQSW